LTVHVELARRADFHIDWASIGKTEFLIALTAELRKPGSALDALIAPHVRPDPLATTHAATQLRDNPDLHRCTSSPSP